MVFANNEGQCCNACVSTDGCNAATFQISSKDHSGGFGPQSWEGFGIHLPDVQPAETTGGLTVDALKEHYEGRIGDHSEFDAFMDYSVTFFTHDLQQYVDSFKADGQKHFLGSWADHTGSTWYSMIFLVPGSTYVIELVSTLKPSGVSVSSTAMEQRMSDAHCDKFRGVGSHPANVMLISSINRASADMDTIDDVYTNLFKGRTTQSITSGGIVRKCYSFLSAGLMGPGPASALDEDCVSLRGRRSQQKMLYTL